MSEPTHTASNPSRAESIPTNVVWLNADHYAYHHRSSGSGPSTPAYDRLLDEGVEFDRAYCPTPICVPSRASMMTGTYAHRHGFIDNGEHTEPDRLPHGEGATYYSDAFRENGRRPGYFGKWHVGYEDTAQDYGFEGWSQPGYGWPYRSERYARYLDERGLPEPEVALDWHPSVEVEELNPVRLTERENQFHDPKIGDSTGVFTTPKETHEAFFVAHLANQWIEDRAADDEPFFARVDVWGPHQPYWIPPAFADTVDPAAIPEYPNWGNDLSDRPDHHREFLATRRTDEYAWADWQPILARCYEHVTAVDHALNQVVETLDRLGIADDTLVLYTADHGDVVGAHGGGFDKGWLLVEETVRTPLAVRWPAGGVPAGETSDALVCNFDYPPTMYEAAGGAAPADMDGESLLDLARDPDTGLADWRDSLMLQHHGHYGERHVQRAFYRGRYKYVAHLDDTDELYDLATDRFEENNRIDDPALEDVRNRLRTGLVEEMKRYGDDAPDARRLRRTLIDARTATEDPTDG